MSKKAKKEEKMSKYLVIFLLCIVLSIIIYFAVKNNNNNNNNSNNEEEIIEENDVVESSITPFDSPKIIKVIINGNEYEMILENNLSALDLLSISPLEMEMEDLNNNEKYYYLSYSLTESDSYYGNINAGDVMLYESNCIVIFYKDAEIDYGYIKLGHINGLEELNTDPISVTFKDF